MTNKTEMVSVPRELAQELDDLLYILTGHDSHQKMIRKYGEEFWIPLDKLRIPLCKALAAPAEDVRAVGDEPVAEVSSKFGDPEAFGERELVALIDIQLLPYGTKLYRRQVVLPERKPVDEYDESQTVKDYHEECGWNACLDEIERLSK